MPVNKKYNIAELLGVCNQYIKRTNRRIFFEYVLLQGQNDTPQHAAKLGRLLQGMLCHVNLIPVNPTGDGPYGRPDRHDAPVHLDGWRIEPPDFDLAMGRVLDMLPQP